MLRQAINSSSRATRSIARTASPAAALSRTQFRAVPTILHPSTQQSIARWYSVEADAATKKASESSGDKPATEGAEAGKTPDADSALRKELEAKTKEALDFKDKYLRSVADFRNLQDRTQREMKSARDFAIQKFAKDLVDSVDNLDRALSMVPADKLAQADKSEELKDLANLHEGLRMTESILMQTLQKHGLERFDPNGEKFNPNEHEATFMTPQPDKENNTVFFTQQKGFRLNGRILRAAKVGVVKNT